MQPQISKGSEPIPGYRVTSFLGSGGFGEVWEAEVPGGLNKAIKFVFGCHDEHRASTELKALERVREVRHPFLISLERIEVVDDRLIIVTELADGSLRDRFNSCRRKGLPGVPRGELCAYLRDAADALDYMSMEHSLQHLDIKPENLLLLSGHVKVVDFGLVKNLRNMTVTLMSGLTPLYAAPEVLRGCPTDRSDQYSLAALYVEVLTGSPPFTGATAGELTYQHLNEKPKLSNLPAADRPVIARALSKEPIDRFPTCKDLAAALLEVRTTNIDPELFEADGAPPSCDLSTAALAAAAPVTVAKTVVCEAESGELSATRLVHSSLNLPPLPDTAKCDLAPLPLDTKHDRPVPTVFLGIGGCAGHVLRDLRRRLCGRFGHVAAAPAIQMLLFDTDPKSLVQVLGGDQRSALDREDTLAMPVRRPKHIGSNEVKVLSWLNRRWLYNIPKSLRTEGLRPLGRLAFVEHAQDAIERIRQAIQNATALQAVEESAKNTGLAFRKDAVRVYLISSISGGSGSGMVLDVAYAARAILDELAIGQAEVIGVFTHATGKKSRHRDVAMVNAFSWLTEFNHYTRPGGSYPGDKTCDLQSFDRGSDALQHSYLVHLGDDLSKEEFIRATEAVSQYVYLDSLTPGAAFFAACRDHQDGAPEVVQNQAKLRTFGVHTVSGYPREIIEDAIANLCRRVLIHWASGGDDGEDGSIDFDSVRRTTQQQARELGLSCQTLVGQAHATIERILGCNGARFLERLFDGKNQFDADQFARAIQTIDKVFGVDEACDASFRILEHPIGEIAAPMLKQRFEEIRQWIVAQIERPDGRMAGAREANRWFSEHLRAIEAEAKNLERHAKQKHRELARAAVPDTEQGLCEQPPGARAHDLRDYFLVRLDERALQLVAYLAGSLRGQLEGVAVELADLTRELESRASECIRSTSIVVQDELFDETGPMSDVRHGVAESLQMSMDDLLLQVNRRIDVHLNDDHGGLYRAMTRRRGPHSPMLDTLRRVACQTVMHAVSKTDLLSNMLHPGLDAAQRQARVQDCRARALPALVSYGGERRLLTVLPSSVLDPQAAARQLQELGINGAVVVGSDNDFMCCYEMGWVSVAHAAVDLIRRSLRHAECSVRLHTRCDVNWTPLPSSCMPAAAANGAPQTCNS